MSPWKINSSEKNAYEKKHSCKKYKDDGLTGLKTRKLPLIRIAFYQGMSGKI